MFINVEHVKKSGTRKQEAKQIDQVKANGKRVTAI
jgi:hypothetical protein